MTKFTQLPQEKQQVLHNSYVIDDVENTYISEFGQPMVKSHGSWSICRVKPENLICGGFHAK